MSKRGDPYWVVHGTPGEVVIHKRRVSEMCLNKDLALRFAFEDSRLFEVEKYSLFDINNIKKYSKWQPTTAPASYTLLQSNEFLKAQMNLKPQIQKMLIFL